MLKILAFDTGGYWIWSKRLSAHSAKPITDSGAKPITQSGQADHLSERKRRGGSIMPFSGSAWVNGVFFFRIDLL